MRPRALDCALPVRCHVPALPAAAAWGKRVLSGLIGQPEPLGLRQQALIASPQARMIPFAGCQQVSIDKTESGAVNSVCLDKFHQVRLRDGIDVWQPGYSTDDIFPSGNRAKRNFGHHKGMLNNAQR